MKPKDETKNKEIYKDQIQKENLMPHLNSNNSSYNPNEVNIGYIDIQNKQPVTNFDPNGQMYGYGYYEDQQGTGPVYVNVKQLACIQKRKIRREYLDTLMAEQKNNYLHESRHRHAMQRKRAPSGRFLTKEETQNLNNEKSL